MAKYMRSQEFDADAIATEESQMCRHWKRRFQSYIPRKDGVAVGDKLGIDPGPD